MRVALCMIGQTSLAGDLSLVLHRMRMSRKNLYHIRNWDSQIELLRLHNRIGWRLSSRWFRRNAMRLGTKKMAAMRLAESRCFETSARNWIKSTQHYQSQPVDCSNASNASDFACSQGLSWPRLFWIQVRGWIMFLVIVVVHLFLMASHLTEAAGRERRKEIEIER